MATYNELKNELTEISKILEKYPDSLKDKVFDLLIKEYDKNLKVSEGSKGVKYEAPKDKIIKNSQKPKKNKKSGESYSLIKELDLRGNKSIASFDAFVKEKQPSSNIYFNAVAVYYLNQMLGIQPITLNHIYTCYNFIKRKPSNKFKQSVWDTASTKYGYLDTSDTEDIKIPLSGINFVKHDLPFKKDKTN